MSIRLVSGAFLADTARVVGDVQLGRDVTVWYGAAIRGDVARITVGDGTNVQDNAVIHCDTDVPNTIGSLVTIGHGAIVHGISVGDGTLVGMGAVLLSRTKVGRNCLVAAGAVVPPNLVVPDGMVVMGVPGRIARETTDDEKRYMAWLAPHYIELANLHASRNSHPRIRPWEGNRS
jgi:carbonic anhydrase/acetyltransferase-like protein (isoleucine patch superfamily)